VAKLTGNNRHNVTWVYAKQCWDALKSGAEIPPIPLYDEWETEETGGKGRVYTGQKPIEPCRVTCNGRTVY
jgi:hypothetical protein